MTQTIPNIYFLDEIFDDWFGMSIALTRVKEVNI